MEREVGGGIGMGNTCKSMADSCQCMTKPTTIKKLKKKRDSWGLPGGPAAKTAHSAGGLGSIPGQRTRSHGLQLKFP